MLKGRFEWNHPEGYLNIPINMETSIDSRYKSDIHVVCNDCKGKVKQKYMCEKCSSGIVKMEDGSERDTRFEQFKDIVGKEKDTEQLYEKLSQIFKPKLYTIGQLQYKYDELNEVLFPAEAEREFCKAKVSPTIKVQEEIPLKSLWKNIETINTHKELFNNEDEYSQVIKQVHQYLMRHESALVVTYGAHNMERAAIITAQDRKLSMTDLRDIQLVRQPVQQNLESTNNEIYEKLVKYTEDLTPARYDEFIERIKNKEPLKVETVEEEVKPQIECAFLKS